jgi:hypothetical protein
MTDLAWRRFLIGLTVFAFAQYAVIVAIQTRWYGILPGVSSRYTVTSGPSVGFSPTATRGVMRLTVPERNAWFSAGVRTGDFLDLRRVPPLVRYRFATRVWFPGETATLPIVRNGQTRWINLRATAVSMNWIGLFVANGGLLWMLLFAVIVVIKRSDTKEGRILALFLLLFNVGLEFQPQNWVTPWPALDAFLAAFSAIPFYGSLALGAAYAGLFGRPLSRERRILGLLAYALGAAAAAGYAANVLGHLFPGGVPPATRYIPAFALSAVVCATILLAILAARGSERSRVIWGGVPLSTLYLGALLSLGLGFFPGNFDGVESVIGNFALLIAPVALTYSLLKRRLLDVGFVINRVAVYTAVSVIVVSIFVLVEWVVVDVFGAGRQENFIVGAVLALGLGLSMRFIHHRVDVVLDNVFFRKRHEDEKAIRDFAHEVAFITDVPTILERIVSLLEERAHAAVVAVALDDGRGRFSGASENDPAFVAMRAWHRPVDLHAVTSALTGEFAFPMVARGRVVGALVLGAKAGGESYAPDEFDAIRALAHAAGNAIDGLRSRTDDDSRAILKAILESLESISVRLQADGFSSHLEPL